MRLESSGESSAAMTSASCAEHPGGPVPLLIPTRRVTKREPPTLGRCARAALAREESTGERVVGDDGDGLIGAEGEKLAFVLPQEQVVAGLHGTKSGRAEALATSQQAGELISEKVRAAGVAELADRHQIIERAHALVDGRVRVVAVQLVQVGVVSASRRSDASIEHMMFLRDLPWSQRFRPVGKKHLVATM